MLHDLDGYESCLSGVCRVWVFVECVLVFVECSIIFFKRSLPNVKIKKELRAGVVA